MLEVVAPAASAAARDNLQQRRAAWIAIGVLLVTAAAVTPFAETPVLAVPGFMTAFGAAMVVINVLLATILFSRGAIEQRSDAIQLGSAYLFVALILPVLIASFPGGVMPGSLIGDKGSAVWLWLFWHGGFGIAILRYSLVSAQVGPQRQSVRREVAAAVAVVIVLGIVGTLGVRYLPAVLQNGVNLFAGNAGIAPLAVLALLIVATLRVATTRGDTPERLPLTVAMVAACFDVWLTYQGTDRYSLGWYLAKCGSLSTSLVVLASLLHQINFLYSRAATANGLLADMARHDGMTGLINRRGLDAALEVEWCSSLRDPQPLALLMIDVDHFKRFNDKYGHPAGDDCLRQVARVLLGLCRRPRDAAARYGGEEFALLLPMTDSYSAVEIAMQFQTAIRALAIPHAGSTRGIVSVSIGIASVPAADGSGATSLVAAADRALYRAKGSGRDAICCADDPVMSDAPAAHPIDSALPAPAFKAALAAQLRLPRTTGAAPTALYTLQCDVLEAVAAGQSLNGIAALLTGKIEQLAPNVICAIMMVDMQGRLHRLANVHWGNARVGDAAADTAAGLPITPDAGPCAAAAWHGAPIEVHDIAADSRWRERPPTEIPPTPGLKACWCNPVKDADGRVIGVLAFYYPSCRAPTAFERNLVDTCLHLLALAIDREAVWSRLRDANDRFDVAISNMSQGLTFFEGDRLLVANRRYCEIYGLHPDSVTPGSTFEHILNLRTAAGSGPSMPIDEYLEWRKSLSQTQLASQTICELANGRVVAINLKPLPNARWVSTHEDITDRRHAEAQIVYIARHDALTGLPNRVLFDERLQQAVALSGRGQRCAALCLDVDNFKLVNDMFGHSAADKVLKAVAERLSACIRDVDTIARLGADEFAILLMGLDRPEGAAELANRIIRAMRQPFEIEDAHVMVTVSIGIALAPEDGTGADKLLKSADTALYRAKRDQRGAYRFFEPEMDARLQMRFTLERDLRQALDDQDFHLVYQPLFDLEANEIGGFEALVRWRHPVRGLISPADFIPIAEETGLIVKLGAWVLQQACVEAATWPKPVKVAVNLSGLQLKADSLIDTVRQALALSGLAATRLELEITESMLLSNSPDTLATLHALRALGISIAMDDFGTGYSSLSYLRSFPFDKIKIDQSFIRDLTDDQHSRAIIRAVVSLGRSMGMVTTAEGVETEAQLAQLRHEGCNEIQGYLLSRPIPPDAVHAMLASREAADRMAIRPPATAARGSLSPGGAALAASA